jgi:hypothetical protein
MLDLMKTVSTTVSVFFESRLELQMENAALRHQSIILRRTSPKRLRLTRLDRRIFTSLHRLWPTVLASIVVVRPKTVVRWHRQGFRLYWRWKCGGKGGRSKVPQELRELIREMSLANSLWGAARFLFHDGHGSFERRMRVRSKDKERSVCADSKYCHQNSWRLTNCQILQKHTINSRKLRSRQLAHH